MGPQSETVRFYRSWFGDLGGNGIGISVGRNGRERSQLVPGAQTASGRRSVLASVGQILGWSNGVANGVRASVSQSRGREQHWDVGDSVGLLALGCGSIGVGVLACWQRWSNVVPNNIGTLVGRRCGRRHRWEPATSWVDKLWDLGRSASGRRLGLRSVGAMEANGVGMPATAWFNRRRDVGWSALGRRSG